MSEGNGHDESDDAPPERLLIPDAKPEDGPTIALVPFDLDRFLDSKSLWAANYFVLWPLGLTLSVTKEDGEVGDARNLDVREWSYPEGEQIETITQTPEENQACFETWLGFVRERILAMKPDERHATLKLFERHSITGGDQILSARP